MAGLAAPAISRPVPAHVELTKNLRRVKLIALLRSLSQDEIQFTVLRDDGFRMEILASGL
jgi:hypothetical protein